MVQRAPRGRPEAGVEGGLSQSREPPQLVPQHRLVLTPPPVFLGWGGSGGGADVDPGAGFQGLRGLLVDPSWSERAVLYFLVCRVIPSSPP